MKEQLKGGKGEKNETLPGGKGDNQTVANLAKKHGVSERDLKKEYMRGLIVEREHTKDMKKVKEIVLDHLAERPDYYTKLKKMEDEPLEKAETPREKKIHKVMKEFKQGILKTSGGKKVTSRDQAIAIAISESKDINKSLTDDHKTAIRNYLKENKTIKDEKFHQFVEKLGINKHRAEEYVYGLAREAQNFEKAKYTDNDKNRKEGKAGMRYGNEIQGGKLHQLEGHDGTDMHYKDQIIKWFQEGKKFNWIQSKLEMYGVPEPESYLKKIVEDNYKIIIGD